MAKRNRTGYFFLAGFAAAFLAAGLAAAAFFAGAFLAAAMMVLSLKVGHEEGRSLDSIFLKRWVKRHCIA